MIKLTKRKAFNFFRSYYDVYNELENDSDKLAFINALLDRQFMGIKPTNLTGMAKFAYISQTNSIDSQVKGYEDKTKIILNPIDTPIDTPTVGGRYTPTVQEKEKEKVKEEYILEEKEFLELFNKCRNHYDKMTTNLESLQSVERSLLNNQNKKYDKRYFIDALNGFYTQKNIYPSNRIRPKHFLENLELYNTCFHEKKQLFTNKEIKTDKL
jgi:hypothetical protein